MEQVALVKALTELRLTTANRNQDAVDSKAQIIAYTRQLSSYPADAVHHVLSTHGKSEKWWPPLAELVERINSYLGDRRSLRIVLEKEIKQRACEIVSKSDP